MSRTVRLIALLMFVAGMAVAQGFDAWLSSSGNDVLLQYDAATDSYYRVHSSDSLMSGRWTARRFKLGAAAVQQWSDPGTMSATQTFFYRIERVLLTNSLDYDEDGLSDAWELIDSTVDPMNPDTDGDALNDGDEVLVHRSIPTDADTDNDGQTDGEEVYDYGTRPESPFSSVTLLYDFSTSEQGWSSDTGTYGVAGVSWSSTGMPSGGALSIAPAAGSGYGDYYVRDGSLREDWRALARPVYRAWFYLPAGAPSGAVRVQPWVKSDSDGWQAHYYSGFTSLVPGQWTLVMWDMTDVGTQVLAEVDEWAMKVVWDNRSTWNGAVLLDSVHLLPNVFPTNLPPQITSVAAVSNTVGKFGKFELNVGVTNVAGLNPYDPEDVDLAAVFTSPSGVVWRVWGFYMEQEGAGYGGWKVRFAPNEAGTWSYAVQVSNRWGASASATSTFTCVASDAHGWVRVSPDDGHYMEHADGKAFYGIGYCRPYDADDEGIFWDARDHGVNLIHWWMAPWDTLLTVDARHKGLESSTFYTYEQSRAAKIDRIVGYAEKYGVKLVFTIWTHDALRDFNYHTWRKNGSWAAAFDQKVDEPEDFINAFSMLDNPPKSQKFFHDAKYLKYQDHLYRYIIARWGYSEGIGIWNLASELYGTYANSLKCVRWQDPVIVNDKDNLVGQDPYANMDTNQVDGSDYTIPWITHINSFFKTHDPFGHPTTACNETDEYWDDGFAIVDVPQIHAYSESYSWVTPPIMLAKYHHTIGERFDKPAFMGETGSWKWQTYQPDFLRACIWPALCAGGAATPMMWTVPAFGEYCDPVMGPWLNGMADEAFLFSRFISDIDFPRLHLEPAAVDAWNTGDSAPAVLENFEGGLGANWHMFGTGIVSMALSTNWSSEGQQSLRMNIDMDTWDNMTNPASGVYNFSLAEDWSSYWPDGTLRLDLYMPAFYHPTNNPDGFLKGINRDPRCIVEIAVESEDGSWRYYSTRTEYAAEHNGWKKLTLGMVYNLELRLDEIPTVYQAQRIRGIKIWMGDAGILRGPVYVDNITVGRYRYNAWGMASSNGTFAMAWIQDRQWTNTTTRNSRFQINGMTPGIYNVEWWNSRREDINTAQNYTASTGTVYVSDVPDFRKDIAAKVRRIGAVGSTVHDVSVGCVSQSEWTVRSTSSKVIVTVVNQGTASETFNVVLSSVTDAKVIGTNRVSNLSAGRSTTTTFTWNTTNATLGWHAIQLAAATVSGETDTNDNVLVSHVNLVVVTPPWDSCNRLRRWGAYTSGSDAQVLHVSTNRATEGAESLYVWYKAPSNNQACIGFDNVFEDWSSRTGITFDVYNDGTANGVQFQMRTGSNWVWQYSSWRGLNAGWNTNLTYSFKSSDWQRQEGTNFYNNVTPLYMDDMHQIYIKISGYTNAGAAYIDNVRLTP